MLTIADTEVDDIISHQTLRKKNMTASGKFESKKWQKQAAKYSNQLKNSQLQTPKLVLH